MDKKYRVELLCGGAAGIEGNGVERAGGGLPADRCRILL